MDERHWPVQFPHEAIEQKILRESELCGTRHAVCGMRVRAMWYALYAEGATTLHTQLRYTSSTHQRRTHGEV